MTVGNLAMLREIADVRYVRWNTHIVFDKCVRVEWWTTWWSSLTSRAANNDVVAVNCSSSFQNLVYFDT